MATLMPPPFEATVPEGQTPPPYNATVPAGGEASPPPFEATVPEASASPPPYEQTVEEKPDTFLGKAWKGVQTLIAPSDDLDARIKRNREALNSADPTIKALVDEAINEYKTRTGKNIKTGAEEAALRAAVDAATLSLDVPTYAGIRAAEMKARELALGVPEDQRQDYVKYYRVFRDSAMERKTQAMEEHPVVAIAGGIVGGIANPLGRGLAAGIKGAGLATRAKTIAAGAELAIWGTAGATADVTEGEWEKLGHQFAQTAVMVGGLQATAKGIGYGAGKLKGKLTEVKPSAAVPEVAHESVQYAEDFAVKQLEHHAEAERAGFELAVKTKDLTPEVYAQLPEETRAAIGRKADVSYGPAGDALVTRQATEAGLSTTDYYGYQWAKRQKEEFTKGIGGDLEGFVAKNGEGFTQTAYNHYRWASEIIDASSDAELMLRRDPNGVKRVGMALLDGREVYEGLQQRHHLEITPHIDAASDHMRRATTERQAWLDAIRESDSLMTKAKVTAQELRSLENLPRSEVMQRLESMAVEKKEAILSHIDLTDRMAEAYGVTKLDPTKHGVYLPKMLRDTNDLVLDMQRLMKQVHRDTKTTVLNLTDGQFIQLKRTNQAFQNLYEGVKYISGRGKGGYASVLEFKQDLYKYLNPDNINARTRPHAGVLEQRIEDALDAPAWMREQNVPKLLTKWTQQVTTYYHIREHVSYLNNLTQILAARGDTLGANYVADHVKDLVGARPTTVGTGVRKLQSAFTLALNKRAIEVGENTRLGQTFNAISALPDLAHMMVNSMYSFFLGGRPDAMLRNISAAGSLTAQHIGTGGYGQQLHVSAMAQMFKDVRDGKPVFKALEDRGIITSQHNPEFYDMLHKGVVSEMSGFKGATDAIAKYAMVTFEYSEKIARGAAYYMGLEWAGDVTRALEKQKVGSQLSKSEFKALRAFNTNMDPYYRKAALAAIEAKDAEKVERLFTTYLNNKTQFSYDKITASEFARTMGPFFSMFTKWPSAVAGDLVNISAGDQATLTKAKRGISKYMLPLLTFASLDYVLPNQKDSDTMDNLGIPHLPPVRTDETIGGRALQYVTGRGSFQGWSPISSVAPIFSGDFTRPPIYQQTYKALSNIFAEGDWVDKTKAVGGALAPMVPGAVLLRSVNDIFKIGFGPDWLDESLSEIR